MTEQKLPDAAYRVTSHEILALLAFEPGPGTRLTRRALGLADLPDDHDLVRAGVGTLNVRDTASVDGEKVSLHGPARHLARVFSSATLWFDITRVGPDSVAPAYIADSPVGRVALFLRPLSEYVCLPMNEGAAIMDMVEATVNDAVAEAAAPSGGIVTSRRYDGGAEPVIANIKVLENGVLQLAAAPHDDSGQLTVRDLAAGEQPGAAVRALLSVPA
ncbi:hypothetical protein [Arthrobacter sp. B10-11]|uniref:hypothetical protein n=1 Tax=Arthrobacter sp. B10-11 TaxID=3081160 RepID=UPI002954175A|nr:hypothetical protein [Arthrobacter sp. B10-11]MDV8146681.1 hypothetical protein [Arthrobacter sp. B10-11]